MLKRLFWLAMGASFGFGTSWWVSRTVKQKIARLAPVRLRAGMAHKARSFGGDMRAAVADGRQAMHAREDRLRAQLEARSAPEPPPSLAPTDPAVGSSGYGCQRAPAGVHHLLR